MARRKWTVADLDAMTFPRQGDLFAWAGAYRDERARLLRLWLFHVDTGACRDPERPLSDRGWLAWSDRKEREEARRKQDLHARALAVAARASMYADIPSWETLRWLVYERDGGICRVCGQPIEPEHYECGHLQDRVAGGLDIPENLIAMCNVCNRLKPVHDTREEALAWCDSRPKEAGWWLRPSCSAGPTAAARRWPPIE